MEFIVREYRPADAAATMRAFRRAVVGSASHDYDAVQTRAWAGHAGSPSEWNARRMAAHTWVAVPVEDACEGGTPAADGAALQAATGEPVGFIDVDDDGYIDMLFVDPSYSRRGVATRLLAQVGRFAANHGVIELRVHASITARPFFASHGFRAVETRRPMIGDVAFVNYLMVRP